MVAKKKSYIWSSPWIFFPLKHQKACLMLEGHAQYKINCLYFSQISTTFRFMKERIYSKQLCWILKLCITLDIFLRKVYLHRLTERETKCFHRQNSSDVGHFYKSSRMYFPTMFFSFGNVAQKNTTIKTLTKVSPGYIPFIINQALPEWNKNLTCIYKQILYKYLYKT